MAGSFPNVEVLCGVKMQSPERLGEVCGVLSGKGLDDSADTLCPLADAGTWNECPYYQP